MTGTTRNDSSARLCRAALLTVATLCAAVTTGAEETRRTEAMRQPVYERMASVYEQVENGAYGAASSTLKALQAMPKLSNYEKSQVWNLAGYVAYLREDYPAAIDAYQTVLDIPDLEPALVQSTLKTVSQLYFTTGGYREAVTTANRLLGLLDEADADLHLLIGQAHFQLGEYARAVPAIERAIRRNAAVGEPPPENWLLLLRAAHHELGDYPAMVSVLKRLIARYPKDEYLLTLAAVYSELSQTRKQLAVLQALYDGRRLDDPGQIVILANLNLLHGDPYRAGVVIEESLAAGRIETSLANLRLLAQAWQQAREHAKAIPVLERAAERAEDGTLYLRLAQSHLREAHWDAAIAALRAGLAKGGLEQAGTAQLMLGMALLQTQSTDSAQDAFQAAAQDPASADQARQWLGYIASERRRAEQLENAVPERDAPRRDLEVPRMDG